MKDEIVDPRDAEFLAELKRLRGNSSRKEKPDVTSQRSTGLSGAPSQGSSSRNSSRGPLKVSLVVLAIAGLALLGGLLKKKLDKDKDGREEIE